MPSLRTNITILCVIVPSILTGVLLHVSSNIVTDMLHHQSFPMVPLSIQEGPTHNPNDKPRHLHSNNNNNNNPIRNTYPQSTKSMKIYIYDMPEEYNNAIRRENHKCASSMFASEVAIHTWLLNSNIRTLDINKADLYYVPAYTTCKSTAFAGNGPDPWAGKELMSKAILWVQKNYPTQWKQKNGRNHIFTAVHDYATCFDFKRDRANNNGPLETLKNSIVLMSLGDTKSPCYNSNKDITIPSYIPTIPQDSVKNKDADLFQSNWKLYLGNQEGPEEENKDTGDMKSSELNKLPVESRSVKGFLPRKIHTFFWGQLSWSDANGKVDSGYSKGIRQNLMKYYKDDPKFVLHHVTREGSGSLEFEKYAGLLDSSIFCLAPAGFAPWTKRLYEVAQHGCIPVIISDVLVMPFEDQLDWSTFSIRVTEKDVSKGNLKMILDNVTYETIKKMQSNLNQIKESLVYRFPSKKIQKTYWVEKNGKGNAFDYIMRELRTKMKTWVNV